MLSLIFDPREILFNPFEDYFGFAWAKVFSQPLIWIGTALTVVASTYAMTQRKNVGWNCARAVGRDERYPVIGGKRMPQSLWTTTDCTCILPIIKTAIPISWEKSVGKFTFKRSVSGAINDYLLGIVFGVALMRLSRFIRILQSPTACCIACVFGMCFAPFFIPFFSFVWMKMLAATNAFSCFVQIVCSPLSVLFLYAVGVFAHPLRFSCITTLLALRAQTVFSVFPGIKIFSGRRKTLIAFRATFERKGDIEHGNFLLSSLVVEGPELGNSVVERFMRPFQALNQYTTKTGSIT